MYCGNDLAGAELLPEPDGRLSRPAAMAPASSCRVCAASPGSRRGCENAWPLKRWGRASQLPLPSQITQVPSGHLEILDLVERRRRALGIRSSRDVEHGKGLSACAPRRTGGQADPSCRWDACHRRYDPGFHQRVPGLAGAAGRSRRASRCSPRCSPRGRQELKRRIPSRLPANHFRCLSRQIMRLERSEVPARWRGAGN